jgi:hypothetical protein
MSDEERITTQPDGDAPHAEVPGSPAGTFGEEGASSGAPAEQLVGGVALSDEDQARLSAFDNDPTHPRGNAEMRQEMGEAMRPSEQMITNIEKSDLPSNMKERMTKDLREKADDLAELAKKRYEAEEAKLTTVRDAALGNLIHVSSSGEEPSERYTTLFEVSPTETGNYRVLDYGLQGVDPLSADQVDRLVQEIFAVAGADPARVKEPADWATMPSSEPGGEGFRNRVHSSNLPGMVLLEQRILDKATGNFTQIRLSAASTEYAMTKLPR